MANGRSAAVKPVMEGVGYRSEPEEGLAQRVCTPQSHPWIPPSCCCLTPGAWPSSTDWRSKGIQKYFSMVKNYVERDQILHFVSLWRKTGCITCFPGD